MGLKVTVCRIAATGMILAGLSSAVLADGEPSIKDAAPAETGRQFTYAITIGGTSDYVFRGISQTQEEPAFQAAVDVSYGIIYAGVWGSHVDFGSNKGLGPDVWAEIDLYGGIKPVWGPVTFDLGAIYYWYPNSDNWANFNNTCPTPTTCPDKIDYVELKAGYSLASPWIKGLVSGTTVYWSPDYTLESGEVWTLESTAAYTLPTFAGFTPTISGTFGTQWGNKSDGYSVGGSLTKNDDEYSYWNAGLSLAIEKFTFDFRYWDTDIDVQNVGLGLCVTQGLCDERFVFTGKVVLP